MLAGDAASVKNLYLCNVKKRLRQFVCFGFTVLYTLVIGLYCCNGFASAPAVAKLANPHTQRYYSVTSSHLLCHTAPSKSTAFISFSTGLMKAAVWIAVPENSAVEQIFHSAFSQYTDYVKNVMVRRRAIVLIFPFHYFF